MKKGFTVLVTIFSLATSSMAIAGECHLAGLLCGRYRLNEVSQQGLYVEVFQGGDPELEKKKSEDLNLPKKVRDLSLQFLSAHTFKLYPGQSTYDLGIKDADYIRFPLYQENYANTMGCSLHQVVSHGKTKILESDKWHKYSDALVVTSFHVVCMNYDPSLRLL